MNRKSWGLVPILFLICVVSVYAAQKSKLTVGNLPAHPAFAEVSQAEVNTAFNDLAEHPRLLLTEQKIKEVDAKIKADPLWNAYFLALKKKGTELAKSAPLEYKKEGRRLLTVSRHALHRLFTWGFLYRYTKDRSWAERSEKEMLALANFSDWNPSHFLDTAEMTMAMAIGYDATFDTLSEQSKKTIRDAILHKGIEASMTGRGQGWFKNGANWNQVCHGGMCYGALAIAESEPELARQIVRRSVNGVTWSMNSYEPDGNYTEGPGYWAYGTSFNIMLITGLQSALKTSFGRENANGLLKSINYFENVHGTTGNAYNYPDSGGGKIFEATTFWYCERFKNPNITWNELNLFREAYDAQNNKEKRKDVQTFSRFVSDRLTVAALLWGMPVTQSDKEKSDVKTSERSLGFIGIGNGLCPVALFRTAWEPQAAYLGIKAGTPVSPHGHMDAGGFVFDNLGYRWAVELGAEHYNKIEQLGMNLWDSGQKGDRWRLFRYNNRSHNTLTINDSDQLVKGKSVFTETKIGTSETSHRAVIDLTPVYAKEVKSAIRTAVLDPDGTLTITDSISALNEKKADVEWRMLTPANVKLGKGGSAILSQTRNGGKDRRVIQMTVDCALPFKVTLLPAETKNSFDAKNPGIQIINVAVTIPSGKKTDIKVSLSEVK